MPEITEADIDAIRAGIDAIDKQHGVQYHHPGLCDCAAYSATLQELMAKLSGMLPTHRHDGYQGDQPASDR